jgi:hypothetical protein
VGSRNTSFSETYINGKLFIPKIKTINIIRQNDCAITETPQSENFTKSQLESINACRLYLQITTIAEIANENGTNILQCSLKGILDESTNLPQLWQYSRSTLDWPYQEGPPAKAWKLWKRLLSSITTNTPALRLTHTLGPWLTTLHNQRQWKYLQYDNDIVTSTTPHQYYRKTPNRQYQQTYHLQNQQDIVINEYALPVIPIYITNDTIVQHDTNEHYHITEPLNQHTIIEDAQVITRIQQNIKIFQINTIHIITNGIIHHSHLSISGLLYINGTQTLEIYGNITRPNEPDNLTLSTSASYFLLQQLQQLTTRNLFNDNVTILFDNKSLVSRIQKM